MKAKGVSSRSTWCCRLAAPALASLCVSIPALAQPIEIVVANEALVAGGKHVEANLAGFVRRLEKVGGWQEGALVGKAFSRPRDALAYIQESRPTFAILPVHQFLQGRKQLPKALRLDVLGVAVGIEGPKPGYWGVARQGQRPYQHIEHHPGLTLAMTETFDLQWINVLFEGNVRPESHFKLLEVPSGNEAIAAVLAARADVALVYERDFNAIKTRTEAGGDLAWVYASGPMPGLPIVAVGSSTGKAARANRKKMTEAIPKMCKGEGAKACSRMAIVYMEPATQDLYKNMIKKYDEYR